MVAYSFQQRFAQPILAGTKGGTIRADRRRHARPGEELQLYTGMRTKRCQLLARKTCVAVEPISISLVNRDVFLPASRGLIHNPQELDLFARFDGFSDFSELIAFWREVHGRLSFSGWHVRWQDLVLGS
jgi:hypothetical protein